MWPFKKKQPKPKPRKIYIPKGRVVEVLTLWDSYVDAKEDAHIAGYKFWMKIEELIPEFKKGSWEFTVKQNLRKPYLLEILKKD